MARDIFIQGNMSTRTISAMFLSLCKPRLGGTVNPSALIPAPKLLILSIGCAFTLV